MKETLKSLYKGIRGNSNPTDEMLMKYFQTLHQWLYSIYTEKETFQKNLSPKGFVIDNVSQVAELCQKFKDKCKSFLINIFEIFKIVTSPLAHVEIRTVSWQFLIKVINSFSDSFPFQTWEPNILRAFGLDDESRSDTTLKIDSQRIFEQTKEIIKLNSNVDIKLIYYWTEIYVVIIFPLILSGAIDHQTGQFCIYLILNNLITKSQNTQYPTPFSEIPLLGVRGTTEKFDSLFCYNFVSGLTFFNISDFTSNPFILQSIISIISRFLSGAFSFKGEEITSDQKVTEQPEFALVHTVYTINIDSANIMCKISSHMEICFELAALFVSLFNTYNICIADPVQKTSILHNHVIRTRLFLSQCTTLSKNYKILLHFCRVALDQPEKNFFQQYVIIILNVIIDCCITDFDVLQLIHDCIRINATRLGMVRELKCILAHSASQLALISFRPLTDVAISIANHVLYDLTQLKLTDRDGYEVETPFMRLYMFQPDLFIEKNTARLFISNFLRAFSVDEYFFIVLIFVKTWISEMRRYNATNVDFLLSELLDALNFITPRAFITTLQIIVDISFSFGKAGIPPMAAAKFIKNAFDGMKKDGHEIKSIAATSAMRFFLAGQTLGSAVVPKVLEYLTAAQSGKLPSVTQQFLVSCLSISIASKQNSMIDSVLKIVKNSVINDHFVALSLIVLSGADSFHEEFREFIDTFILTPGSLSGYDLLFTAPLLYDDLTRSSSEFFEVMISAIPGMVDVEKKEFIPVLSIFSMLLITAISCRKMNKALLSKAVQFYHLLFDSEQPNYVAEDHDAWIKVFNRPKTYYPMKDYVYKTFCCNDSNFGFVSSSSSIVGYSKHSSFCYDIDCDIQFLLSSFPQIKETQDLGERPSQRVINVLIHKPTCYSEEQYLNVLAALTSDGSRVRKTPFVDIKFDEKSDNSEISICFSKNLTDTHTNMFTLFPVYGSFLCLCIHGQKVPTAKQARYILSKRDAAMITLTSILVSYMKTMINTRV